MAKKHPVKKKTQTPRRSQPPALWIGLGVILVSVLTIFIAVYALNNDQPDESGLPAEVTVAEANALVNDGAFLLDVREPSEWEDFHVPGATLIPLGELDARLNEVPRDRQVVVICRTGNRSQSGRDILLQAGFEQVTSVAGGVTDWRAEGLPVVSGP